MWMPLLPVRKGVSSLEVIAGSHLRPDEGWPNTYNAKKLARAGSATIWCGIRGRSASTRRACRCTR